MEERVFDRDFVLENIMEFDEDGAVKVNEPISQSRWTTDYLLIFEYEDCLWQTQYSRGNGDNGEMPFEYSENIKCIRVFEKPVMSVEYVTEVPEDGVS